jgi:hypothetical protein
MSKATRIESEQRGGVASPTLPGLHSRRQRRHGQSQEPTAEQITQHKSVVGELIQNSARLAKSISWILERWHAIEPQCVTVAGMNESYAVAWAADEFATEYAQAQGPYFCITDPWQVHLSSAENDIMYCGHPFWAHVGDECVGCHDEELGASLHYFTPGTHCPNPDHPGTLSGIGIDCMTCQDHGYVPAAEAAHWKDGQRYLYPPTEEAAPAASGGGPKGDRPLNAILERAAALWREHRLEHPYVDTKGMSLEASKPFDQADQAARERILESVMPIQKSVLLAVAADDRIWEFEPEASRPVSRTRSCTRSRRFLERLDDLVGPGEQSGPPAG